MTRSEHEFGGVMAGASGALLLGILSLPFLGGCSSVSSPSSEAVGAAVTDVDVNDGHAALELLLEGNRRFVAGESRHDHESPARRLRLAKGQHPFGIVLGCSDSRVPPELLFDTGLGDLFVIRVAGNVAGVDETGSIEYGMAHLHTHLVMVLGHQACGAVTAVVEPSAGEEPPELEHLLHAVHDAVGGLDPSKSVAERVHLAVEANVRHQVQQLAAIRERVQAHLEDRERMLIVGAIYELDTGRVRVIETL